MPGDLVGVIQKKDPMGSTDRWFVDNGVAQGFVPARVLGSLGHNGGGGSDSKPSGRMPAPLPEPVPPVADSEQEETHGANSVGSHAYDDVAENDDADEGDCDTITKKPVRKAPPLPPPIDNVGGTSNSNTGSVTYDNSVDPIGDAVEPREGNANQENDTSDSSKTNVGTSDRSGSPPIRTNSHGYEEIAAASEASAEVNSQQDLSPIYEEIHGGSRSTASTSSSSSSNTNANASALLNHGKFHYSLYDFTATDSTMLNLGRGQVIRVIQATEGEWWYVEDRHGLRGYVPSQFLKVYPVGGVVIAQEEEEQGDVEGSINTPSNESNATNANEGANYQDNNDDPDKIEVVTEVEETYGKT